jgi:DNA polymerase-1
MSFSGLESLLKIKPRGHRYELVIVDGNNLFYRSYFGFSRSTGLNAFQGTFGTIGFLADALSVLGPSTILVCCWDSGPSRRRLALFPQYKDRKKDNPKIDYEQQAEDFRWARELSGRLPIFTAFSLDGVVEGDDLIYSVAQDFLDDSHKGGCCIISADRDFLQIVSEDCHVFSPMTQKLFTPATTALYVGCPPQRYLFLKALTGDSTDTIPGVPRIGETMGLKIVERYGSLEEMEQDPTRCQDIPRAGKIPAHILAHRDIVNRNLQLMRLEKVRYDLKFSPDLDLLIEKSRDLGYVSLRPLLQTAFGG